MEINDIKIRDEMMIVLGMLESIKFPLIWGSEKDNSAYYDLIDSIIERYRKILNQVIGYEND